MATTASCSPIIARCSARSRDAVVQHKLFAGNRLPTKKETFDWTLGPGSRGWGSWAGAIMALFLFTNDSYGSAGRKAAQVVGLLFGAYIPSGVHIGYAGLVDLKTGELVWINADVVDGRRRARGRRRDEAGRAVARGLSGSARARRRRRRGASDRALRLMRHALLALLPVRAGAGRARRDATAAPSVASYQPQGTDERGLWMEMEEAERDAQDVRLRDPRSCTQRLCERRVVPHGGCRPVQGGARLHRADAVFQRQHGTERHDAGVDAGCCCARATRRSWQRCSGTSSRISSSGIR